MNPTRVASALRQLADAVEAPEDIPNEQPSSSRIRRAKTLVRPAGESDEVAAAKARRLLRANGYRKVDDE
ncbi:MAG: hypothetical protein ACRELY_14970 [Polyangiaceae bacterium]